jgi:hypothetical protein
MFSRESLVMGAGAVWASPATMMGIPVSNRTCYCLWWLIGTVFRDYVLQNLTMEPAMIAQCTSFEGAAGGADTSPSQIANITWRNMTGTIDGGALG